MNKVFFLIPILFLICSCATISEIYKAELAKAKERLNEDEARKKKMADRAEAIKKAMEEIKKQGSLDVEVPVINVGNEDKEDEYIEYRETTEPIKEAEKENLNEGDNCPQEIYQEFHESTFKEKFTSWQYITLINLLCTQKENGLMITINYRSLETTALRGFFVDWSTVIGSAKKIFQSAFNFPQVGYVELHFYNPYLDEFGNQYLKHEVTMNMECELAEKINWKNITENMFWSLLSKRGLIKTVDGEEIQYK